MAVLLGLEGKAANKIEMAFYCSNYCKYNSVCDGNNKSFRLESTNRAIEIYKAQKKHDFNYLDMPYRTQQLVSITERVIEKEKING